MQIDMQLKPADIVLLKVLACVLIAFFIGRFLILPAYEKHNELVQEREELTVKQEEMQHSIDNIETMKARIETQKVNLKQSIQGYYEPMENQEIDELITSIISEQNLQPVYLSIGTPTVGVPSAYQQAEQAEATTSEDESTEIVEDDEREAEQSEEQSTQAKQVNYVNTVKVDATLKGSQDDIYAFFDNIAKNYAGIQVLSFQMSQSRYVDSSLQSVEQTSCQCVLAVYICGEMENAVSKEES